MEKKEKMSLSSIISLAFLCTIIFLMFVSPIQLIGMEHFIEIEFLGCIALFIYTLIKHSKETPTLAFKLSFFILVVNIGLTKITLINTENGKQIPIVSFLSNVMCHKGIVIGMILITFFILLSFILTKKTSKKIGVLAKKTLTSTTKDDIDFLSDIDGAAKFLLGTTNATLFIVIASIAGGVGLEKFMHNKSWQEAVKISITNTSGNVPLFFIPLLLVTLSLEITIWKINKTGKHEYYK